MISRKRQYEDDVTNECSFNFISTSPMPSSPMSSPDTKKFQRNKIHSEIHTKTITMMMQAQLILQQEEKLNNNSQKSHQEDIKMDEEEKEEVKSTYHQRPYW